MHKNNQHMVKKKSWSLFLKKYFFSSGLQQRRVDIKNGGADDSNWLNSIRVSGVREGIHLCQCECCGWGRPWSYSKLLSKVKSSLTNFISSFFMGTELLALCNPTVQKMQDSRLKLISLLNFVELVSMQRYSYIEI